MHYINIPHFKNSFTSWWTFRLFLFFCYYKCQHEYSGTGFCMDIMLSLLLTIYLGVDFLGHMVTLWLTFWEISRLFSKVVAPFYISTSNIQLLHTLTIYYCLPFYFSHSGGCELVSYCAFDLCFPYDKWFWESFYVLINHSSIFSKVLSED